MFIFMKTHNQDTPKINLGCFQHVLPQPRGKAPSNLWGLQKQRVTGRALQMEVCPPNTSQTPRVTGSAGRTPPQPLTQQAVQRTEPAKYKQAGDSVLQSLCPVPCGDITVPDPMMRSSEQQLSGPWAHCLPPGPCPTRTRVLHSQGERGQGKGRPTCQSYYPPRSAVPVASLCGAPKEAHKSPWYLQHLHAAD